MKVKRLTERVKNLTHQIFEINEILNQRKNVNS